MSAMTSSGGLNIRVRVDASKATAGMANLKRKIDKLVVTLQNETRDEAIRELKYTTSTWKHQPVFKGTVWHRGTSLSVGVSTADKVFIYVDQGTKAHIIAPKHAGYPLSFQWGGPGSYKAKSRIGILRSYKGGTSGGPVAFMHVHHPGTEARKFMDKVQQKVGKWALKRARQLMREAAEHH
jgi:hypothetical protein